jgi:hypothetical protein
MPRLSREMQAAIQLARVCKEHGIDPRAAAELVALSRRAFKAGERYASIDRPGLDKLADRASEAVEKHAHAMGLETTWPGLYPAFTKGGRPVYLPE